MTGGSEARLAKVENELCRYEHPLFEWSARTTDTGVEVRVQLKQPGIHDEAYAFTLTPREIDARAFEWDFQRQLYNYLHDFVVEMFTRSPQIRDL
ncbi:MAG TPA: hypothetical protein VJH03_11320 [Blastocatellia bacterium]|nr:hypothetical protein [Blastocatellia bacterium]